MSNWEVDALWLSLQVALITLAITTPLALALGLNILPLGRQPALPDLLAVALVFWNVHQPRRVGVPLARPLAARRRGATAHDPLACPGRLWPAHESER